MMDTQIQGSQVGLGVEVQGGDFIGRDRISIEQLIVQIYQAGQPLQLDAEALRALRDTYLQYLREFHQHLDFKGIRLPDAPEKTAGLLLRDVYVPVRARLELPEGETWHRIAGRDWKDFEVADLDASAERAKRQGIDLERFLRDQAAIVVLGDPGAGKSTLMKHLALRLAAADSGALPAKAI